MDLGPHAAFILGAYSVALLIVAALIAWVIVDNRRQRQMLSDLEARGITRRSERAAEKQL
jgi:heme exporter protein D